nr:SH3 domain-containing protein [uncultured Oscillibacter sp.]
MAMKRCPVCGERYSDTYRYCPFCEEEDLDREEEARRAPSRSGRRVGVGSGRQPNLVTPVLVVLILLMAALLVYLLWGDKIAAKFDKDKEPDSKPGVEDPVEPDQKDPAAQEPSDPTVTDPNVTTPEEPGGEMPEGPDTNTPGGTTTQPAGPTDSYGAASALPGGLTYTNIRDNDFTRGVSEGVYQLKVSGGSGTYTWMSEDPGIASVDSSGNVTPLAAGITHILVTDGSRKAVCTVRVTGGGSAPSTTPTTPTTPSTGGGTLKAGPATVINGGNGVRVRSGPGTNYDILATVPNGGSVQVVQSVGNDWYEITFSNVGGVTTSGYMKGEFLSN